MDYNLMSLLFGIFLAIIVCVIEFWGWNILLKKNRKHKKSEKHKYLEDNNEIINDLFSEFESLRDTKYAYSEREKYISCLKGKNIEQIQHAKELIDASLEATTFWGIWFTLFNAILSKVVSLIAGMYADALFDSESKAATNIENLLLLALLVFTLFFIYKSMNTFQKEKYFFNILQEQLGKLKENDCSINIVNNIEVEQGIVKGESKKKKKKHKR
jgi:hypothetical protein